MLLFLESSFLLCLVNLVIIRHENFHQDHVGNKDAYRQNDPIHTSYVGTLVETNNFFYEQERGRDIRTVIETIAYANEERDQEVHLDVLKLA